MTHIARTNYANCAGLKDSKPPAVSQAVGKHAVIKFVADFFDYCSGIVPDSSPDGGLNGREILLAMYVHGAHHRGQAEVYLRDKGIKPPSFVF
jgi:hypothetical protein